MPPAPIYLDHNATTPIDPAVVEAMARAWKDFGANPASQHSPGRKARRALEDAREGILELLGAKTGGIDADQLIFTSGGTEANNLALFGLFSIALFSITSRATAPIDRSPILFSSAIEHPSISSPAPVLRKRGIRLVTLPVNENGLVGLPTVEDQVKDERPASVCSVMLANNETGVIQPIAQLTRDWRNKICGVLLEAPQIENGFFHTDAVQAVGKIPVHFRDLGVHAMTVAPHKFHGPLGIGALVLRHWVKIHPILFGGFQQGGARSGTESVALATGFHEALKIAIADLSDRATRMQSLRDQLELTLRADFPSLVIIGENSPRLPNTSCISFPGLNRQALVIALDLAGVACSTGSACASGSSEPSPTLVAMGLPKAVVEGSIRLSLGAFTTAAEATEAARRIVNCVKHLQSQK
jgi:cysteine desulfurase